MIFKNFLNIKNNKKIKKDLKDLLKEQPKVLETLKPTYRYSYSKKKIRNYKKFSNIRIIGMGGSILGSEAIYDFLKPKIQKKITFVNNLNSNADYFDNKNINLNLIISKSGNTLETIVNANTLITKKEKNIIITEAKNSYLTNLATKLKSEIFEHKNYVGGRYSVLSEVGMLPAELMNLDEKKFKQFNNLIKNKNFINNLINNVSTTLNLIKSGKQTSIILNYDEQSENLFKWYQQLIAESLGKKSLGLLPVVSSMPKDNHSLMQLYLDGPNKYFYTFFNVLENKNIKIKNSEVLSTHKFLKNLSIEKIKQSQMIATEKVFISKKIPFRSFRILKRNEQSLGELFCFFILETILLGRALNVNPFDQPSVELIKTETKKILI
jgi:glucose-6-phosphate isomerase